MTQTMKKASPLSAGLVNASILLYTAWLLLPAVQTTGRAATGALAVGVFGLGVLLDAAYLKKRWAWLLLRACCAAAMPLVLWFFLSRGGGNFAGFYVQQAMFWFPLVFCAYARERGDGRMWRWLKPLLLAVMVATTLTTVGWLVEGMLRGGRVYAYSRSLGSGEPGREAYLKELMLRNIGGYDFVYATVLSLPLTCIGVQRARGWRRAGYAAFLGAQVVMIVLSQYTYAMVFAAAILAVELTALAVRAVSRGRVKMGASLLWGLVPVVAVYVLRFPLVTLAADICEGLGLSNFAFSFQQLLLALEGGATDEASRLGHYLLALDGLRASPLVGSMFGGEKLLSQHSDILDLLSGMGLLGTAAVGTMLWAMGRGCARGLRASAERPQLLVMFAALAATALLGTVVYSRDIMLVFAMGLMLVLEGKRDNSPAA